MRNTTVLLVFTILFSTGCSKKNESEKHTVNGKTIKALLVSATNKNVAANDSLNKLIDFKFPANNNHNNLFIDSIKSSSGKTFYAVLLQYPNPAYNRFAVYDSLLNCYLIDKSLSGNILLQNISVSNLNFIKVKEHFTSKDIFDINRLSLYSVKDTSVNLVFRTFVSFKYFEYEFDQRIEEITNISIKTSIISNRYSPVNNKSDEFIFNRKSGKYESADNLFKKFVVGKIDRSKIHIEKPQITDVKSLMKSVQ